MDPCMWQWRNASLSHLTASEERSIEATDSPRSSSSSMVPETAGEVCNNHENMKMSNRKPRPRSTQTKRAIASPHDPTKQPSGPPICTSVRQAVLPVVPLLFYTFWQAAVRLDSDPYTKKSSLCKTEMWLIGFHNATITSLNDVTNLLVVSKEQMGCRIKSLRDFLVEFNVQSGFQTRQLLFFFSTSDAHSRVPLPRRNPKAHKHDSKAPAQAHFAQQRLIFPAEGSS